MAAVTNDEAVQAALERDRVRHGDLKNIEYLIVFVPRDEPKPDSSRPNDYFHALSMDQVETCEVEIKPNRRLTPFDRCYPVNMVMKDGSRYKCSVFARCEHGVRMDFLGSVLTKLQDAYIDNTKPNKDRLDDLVSRFPDVVVENFNYPDRKYNQKFERIPNQGGPLDGILNDITVQSDSDLDTSGFQGFCNEDEPPAFSENGHALKFSGFCLAKGRKTMRMLDEALRRYELDKTIDSDSPDAQLGHFSRHKRYPIDDKNNEANCSDSVVQVHQAAVSSPKSDSQVAAQNALSQALFGSDTTADSSPPVRSVAPAQIHLSDSYSEDLFGSQNSTFPASQSGTVDAGSTNAVSTTNGADQVPNNSEKQNPPTQSAQHALIDSTKEKEKSHEIASGSKDLDKTKSTPDQLLKEPEKKKTSKRAQDKDRSDPPKARKKLKMRTNSETGPSPCLNETDSTDSDEESNGEGGVFRLPDDDDDFECEHDAENAEDAEDAAGGNSPEPSKFAEPLVRTQVFCGKKCRCNKRTSNQLRLDWVLNKPNKNHASLILFDRGAELIRGRQYRQGTKINKFADKVANLELTAKQSLEIAQVFISKKEKVDKLKEDATKLGIPWKSYSQMLVSLEDETLCESLDNIMRSVTFREDKMFFRNFMEEILGSSLRSRLFLDSGTVPKPLNGKIVILGERYYPIPKQLLKIAKEHMTSFLQLPETEAQAIMKAYLLGERVSRKKAVSKYLEYLMAVSPHPLYEAIWLCHECHLRVFDEAAPFWRHNTFQEKSDFFELYRTPYQLALEEYQSKSKILPKMNGQISHPIRAPEPLLAD